MLKKLCVLALLAGQLCAFDLCLATYYPFIDDHRYVDLELYASAVGTADIDEREFIGSDLHYAEGATAAFINAYINDNNALSFQLGYGLMYLDWNENPFFDQDVFHDAIFSIAYVTTALENWRWVFNLGAHLDAEHWNPIDYAFYNLVTWGRLQYFENLGLHVGLVATSGNTNTNVLPILGFDWFIFEKLRLAAVYPCEGSLMFFPYRWWSINATYRGFGGYYKSFHRVGENEMLPEAVVSVFSTGFDLGMTFRNTRGKLEVYGGWNLGGWMLIGDCDGDNERYIDFCGAPYVGLQASLAF